MPDHRARRYCVSTVGRDEDQIRRSIREREELRRDQDRGELNLGPHTTGPGGGRRLLAGYHHRSAD
jgi:hypothetical protein